MLNEPLQIEVSIIPVQPINAQASISSYGDIQEQIDNINEQIDEIEQNMPNSFIVMDVTYIDGTSEQLKVAIYENK